jgi:hypothetical protein
MDDTDDERRAWLLLAEQAFSRAYGDDEPEYTLDDIKEPNPDYKGAEVAEVTSDQQL